MYQKFLHFSGWVTFHDFVCLFNCWWALGSLTSLGYCEHASISETCVQMSLRAPDRSSLWWISEVKLMNQMFIPFLIFEEVLFPYHSTNPHPLFLLSHLWSSYPNYTFEGLCLGALSWSPDIPVQLAPWHHRCISRGFSEKNIAFWIPTLWSLIQSMEFSRPEYWSG